jgi:hypothetical protein
MSEDDDAPGSFLRRWSRRKRAADTPVGEERRPSESGGAKASVSVEPDMAASPGFDSTHLPPIESINAASDVRGFLAPGVPAELSRAALRRAWVSDPAIRDFVGLAENQWDFTKPGSVPGFGPLHLTPQMRRIIRELVTGVANEAAPSSDPDWRHGVPAPQKPHEKTSVATDHTAAVDFHESGSAMPRSVPAVVRDSTDAAAAQQDSEGSSGDRGPTRRRHGSALPK